MRNIKIRGHKFSSSALALLALSAFTACNGVNRNQGLMTDPRFGGAYGRQLPYPTNPNLNPQGNQGNIHNGPFANGLPRNNMGPQGQFNPNQMGPGGVMAPSFNNEFRRPIGKVRAVNDNPTTPKASEPAATTPAATAPAPGQPISKTLFVSAEGDKLDLGAGPVTSDLGHNRGYMIGVYAMNTSQLTSKLRNKADELSDQGLKAKVISILERKEGHRDGWFSSNRKDALNTNLAVNVLLDKELNNSSSQKVIQNLISSDVATPEGMFDRIKRKDVKNPVRIRGDTIEPVFSDPKVNDLTIARISGVSKNFRSNAKVDQYIVVAEGNIHSEKDLEVQLFNFKANGQLRKMAGIYMVLVDKQLEAHNLDFSSLDGVPKDIIQGIADIRENAHFTISGGEGTHHLVIAMVVKNTQEEIANSIGNIVAFREYGSSEAPYRLLSQSISSTELPEGEESIFPNLEVVSKKKVEEDKRPEEKPSSNPKKQAAKAEGSSPVPTAETPEKPLVNPSAEKADVEIDSTGRSGPYPSQ